MKTINNFITTDEAKEIIDFSKSFIKTKTEIENKNVKALNEASNGWTFLYDITKSNISKEISKHQGDTTQIDYVSEIFINIADRIAKKINLNKENMFFQYIYLGSGGEVKKHYDVGLPGYITYKCNISVDGPDLDYIYIDKEKLLIEKFDLYCFEANFYQHWMDKSDKSKIHLSYGFVIPYADLGWNENDSRVRLSNKIWEKYIKLN
jgi:hypothetical protein